MKLFNVEAQWHMLLKTGGHRVKVSVLNPDLSFYINGMVVYPPDGDKYQDWSVLTPKVGNARIIEFAAKTSKLWPEIKEACIDAVKEQLRHDKLDSTDDAVLYESKSPEEFNKHLMDDLKNAGF
jgi:hypothetical protein